MRFKNHSSPEVKLFYWLELDNSNSRKLAWLSLATELELAWMLGPIGVLVDGIVL